MRVTKPLERWFLSAQSCCLVASVIASAFANGLLSDVMLMLSFMFGGAFLGAFFYGRASSGEVTHG